MVQSAFCFAIPIVVAVHVVVVTVVLGRVRLNLKGDAVSLHFQIHYSIALMFDVRQNVGRVIRNYVNDAVNEENFNLINFIGKQ